MSIVILADNGDTLLGADADGKLYDGQRIGVGWDEFLVETTLTDTGFERTTSCTCGELIGKDSRDKDSFLAELERQQPDSTSEDREAVWSAEVENIPHSKVYVDVLVDGVMSTIEKKRPCIQWTPKETI